MIIENFSDLSITDSRKDALEIINAGIESSLTKNAMSKFITLDGTTLNIKGSSYNLDDYGKLYVIGGGKASADMAAFMEELLGDRIYKGIVTDVRKKDLKIIEVVEGTHPVPSEVNVNACQRMVDIAREANDNDLIITLISGGGSALLANPRTHVGEDIKMSEALLRSGADIYEMNTIRKHISKFKGGQLSATAHPTQVVSIIFSDVLGNDLSVIASGPTDKDKTTMDDVQKLIKKYDLPKLHESDWKETPKEDSIFDKTNNILLLDNSVAVEAMKRKAEELGYQVEVLGYELKGEAREVGLDLAKNIKPGVAMIAAGETTVTVKGKGKGGRNQELALGAIGHFEKPGVIISAGTDGIDNTPAAGAVVDEKSYEKAKNLDLNTQAYLDDNNVFPFFEKMNDLIMTGPTGTNVADIMLALGSKNS